MTFAQKLYDLHCEHLGNGKRGHPHWDDLPHETRVQWGKFAAAASALDEIPPPSGPGPDGGPPA